MKLYAKLFSLSLLLVFMSGFTWGADRESRCREAAGIFESLSSKPPDDQRSVREKQILDLCPDGAAASLLRGASLERTGDRAGALREYRKAVEADETNAVAHGSLGLLLLEKGEHDEAATELTKGLMGKPDPRFHRGLARILSNGGMYSLALFHFRQALEGMPTDSAILAEMGGAFAGLGQLDKTEEIYRKLLAADPANIPLRLELAGILRKQNRLDESLKELNAVIASRSDERQAHRLQAAILQEKGDEEAARNALVLAGVSQSSQIDDLLRQGDDGMLAGNFKKAATAYKKALKIKPDIPEALKKLGDAEMALGEDDAALATYQEALLLSGLDSESLFNLGTLHERKGEVDEAISVYSRALQANPSNTAVRRRLADIQSLRGNFPQAIDLYTSLIKDRHDNPILHLKLGSALQKSRKYKEAAAAYEEAIRLDPENLEGRKELAVLYSKIGSPDRAAGQYLQILRLKPEDRQVRTALTALYVKSKDYVALTALLEEGTRLFPDDANSHYRLGIVYEYQKDYPAAIREYQKTTDILPTHAKGLNALGRLLLKTGRKNEAREFLEKARKADPALAEPRMLLMTIKEDLSAESVHKKKKRPAKKNKRPVRKKKTRSKRK